MHVIIVGAGIAGMTAAITLRQKGHDVTVLEQASALKEIGAGIQLAANGSLVLRELGLEEAVAKAGVIPQSYEMRDISTGKLLNLSPLGDMGTKRWGAPLYNIHRADLIDILARAVPAGVLRLGAQVEDFVQDNDGVTVRLTSGEEVRGDVLIGADGIHSVVRKQLRGEEPTHFSNILMWRALIPAEKLRHISLEEKGNYWFGPGRTLITYWVRSNNLYSILASVPVTEVQRESWTESGDIEELQRSFSDIEPRARQMMEQIETSFLTGMYYRDPIDRWTYGRVTLMGDAAHPMVPFLAQGACQGIEDAWTMATVLSDVSSKNVGAALQEYEQRRRPRTTRVQSGARAMVKLTHESEADRIRARNGRWKGMQHIDPMTETTWGFVWGYDVLAAVKQPAGEVLGLSATREGKSLKRPESQRAFSLWKNAFSPEQVARGHDGLREGYEEFLTKNFPLAQDVAVEAVELRGVPALRVHAAKKKSNAPTVLHFHGGGYVLGSARGSLEYAHRLAETVGGTCVTVDYRLAPDHPYPAAIDDALDAYRGLIESGVPASSVLLSGESSGGGLAIAVALALKTAGDTLPAGIISVCPFSDLTLRGPSVSMFAGDDPAANKDMLAYLGASYFQGHEPTDPLVSPLYGDLAGLPPMFLTASEGEVLLSDTTRLIERAKRAGVDVTSRIVDDSVHVYTIFPFLPETVSTMKAIGEWAGKQTGRQARTGQHTQAVLDVSRASQHSKSTKRKHREAFMRVLGRLMAASALGLLMAGGAHGQGISNGTVKIGVLGDMSGVFQDLSGASSVAAAKMAVDDFVKNEKPSFKVELVTSDHQNKPDIAVSRVREWYDVDGVDMVTDAINSAVALAVSGVTREKNRVLMVTGAGTTALINEQCSPNTILYAWDTYGISNALAGSITRSGKKNWYFLSVDYALGQAIEKDATRAIDAAGGKVVGSRKHPTGTADFSSFVLTAQNSGADVIGLANAGGDLINSVKAAQDFGITQKQTIAPMAATLMDIHAIGLASSQGLMLVEGFYWNRNDESRAWSERFFKERNRMPIMLQAGLYSAITTYLKAVKETGTDDAKMVLDHMKKMEINDLFAKGGRIRADGRMVYDMYVLAVKKPAESKKAWDYLEIRDTISGKDAYQPLSDSRCPLVKN